MSIIMKPAELAALAKEPNIVLNAALKAVSDNAAGIDNAGATSLAVSLGVTR